MYGNLQTSFYQKYTSLARKNRGVGFLYYRSLVRSGGIKISGPQYELGKFYFYRDRGDWQGAQRHLVAARNVFRHDEADPVFNIELAWVIMSNLGFVEHQLGNFDTAEQIYLQCLSFFKELGGRRTMTTLLTRLALLEEPQDNRATAQAYASEALHWARGLGMVEEQTLVEGLLIRLA